MLPNDLKSWYSKFRKHDTELPDMELDTRRSSGISLPLPFHPLKNKLAATLRVYDRNPGGPPGNIPSYLAEFAANLAFPEIRGVNSHPPNISGAQPNQGGVVSLLALHDQYSG